jgi:amino-acid N-acetyltransferase
MDRRQTEETPAERPVLALAGKADHGAVADLLRRDDLPVEGLAEVEVLVVARDGPEVVGCAALEGYGDAVLLRSVAVAAAWRGRGLGRALTETALHHARRAGAQEAYLLTTTAEAFFVHLGFTVVARAQVPEAVRASVEFQDVCPASAAVMHQAL